MNVLSQKQLLRNATSTPRPTFRWTKVYTTSPFCIYYFGPFDKIEEAERSALQAGVCLADSKMPTHQPSQTKIRKVSLGETVQQEQVLYQLLSFDKQSLLPPTQIEVVAQQNGIVYDLASNQGVNMGEYVLATF